MNELKYKVAQKMVGLIDLHYLSRNLDANKVIADIEALGKIAALTTFTQHVPRLKELLGDEAPIVTAIINYPDGNFNTYNAIQELKAAVAAGADEVDIVFPYQALVNRQAGLCLKFLTTLREEAGDHPLKLTIEVDMLQEAKWIRKATELAIRSGMNCVKTTSGWHRRQITLPMIQVMLHVIKEMNPNVGVHVTTNHNYFIEASQFLEEVINQFGISWVDASYFRLSGPNLAGSIQELMNEVPVI